MTLENNRIVDDQAQCDGLRKIGRIDTPDEALTVLNEKAAAGLALIGNLKIIVPRKRKNDRIQRLFIGIRIA
ncbi:hypothetical protein MWN34_08745 [Ancylobacter sp. 6x-1]|uniref:Uncharacterized protein n=1 Tax=Ancylobacter crimeensis TaxID=2579147 RepID=A0ABT0DAP4_9HYPH|nr:hypothetical protein [Ancylobacter crimeensis]MCK0197000.1 hypothetical protein [Ancylobacter crimeensis]